MTVGAMPIICDLGLEGIVSKKLNAPYRSGPSRTWIKVKNPKAPNPRRRWHLLMRIAISALAPLYWLCIATCLAVHRFAGGGQIGCDYQFAGAWVIGIRNLFDGTSISHTRDIDPFFFNTAFSNPRIETKVQWFDILTGRIGYLAQTNLLFYAQGGAAWAHAQEKFIEDFGEVAGSKTSRHGWPAGGGGGGRVGSD